MNHIWVIRNPIAGWYSNYRVEKMLSILRKKNIKIDLHDTCYAGHAEKLACEACNSKADLILVCGGDGTLNEVVNGIMTFYNQVSNNIPMIAIFPSGTVNLVASELNIPKNPRHFTETLFQYNYDTIWPAKINNRYFLSVAGIGFDSEIVSKITRKLKKRYSKLSYIYETCSLLSHDWQKQYEISIDNISHLASSVLILNGKYYAGKYTMFKSRLTTPDLYVCLFKSGRKSDILAYILYLVLDKLEKHDKVSFVPVKEVVKLVDANGSYVQVDGDSVQGSQLIISCGKIPLRIITSKNKRDDITYESTF